MSDGIRINISDEPILAGLDRLDAATANRKDANNAIGAYFVTATQRRFERETGPDGRPWARLKPRTAAARIGGHRRGYENMLRVTARLFQSIVYDAGEDDITVGTNVIYAALQQLGGTIEMPARQQTIYQNYDEKKDLFDPTFRRRARSNFARDVTVAAHLVTVPGRPYLGVDDADRKEVLSIIEDHFKTQGGLQ
jgi:phage virion morphogenesis protein